MNHFLKIMGLLCLLSIISLESCKHEPIKPNNTGNNSGGNTGSSGSGNGNNGGGTTIGHPCDPDTVYFAKQILPLIISNCSMSGCHDAQTQADGVVLTNYQNIRSEVEPYDPWDSELYESLFDNDDLMPPPPRSPLSTDDKALIRKWINQGAKNLTCDEDCDTTNVTFAISINPIIQTKCTGCHSTAVPLGGVVLETYADIKASGDNGSLMGTILNNPGYNLMPPSGGKLPTCEIDMIQKWIDNGMPNN